MISLMKPTGSRDPFALMDDIRRSFWSESYSPFGSMEPFASATTPRIVVDQDEGSLRLRVDLPGGRADDVKVQAEGDTLTLSGQRRVGVPEGYRELRRERGETRFSRRLRLGPEWDLENARARFDDGVLTVAVPRRPELRPRKIPIQAVAIESESSSE